MNLQKNSRGLLNVIVSIVSNCKASEMCGIVGKIFLAYQAVPQLFKLKVCPSKQMSIMYAYFQPWLEGACWGGLLLLLHQPDVWHPGLFHQELGRSRVRNQRHHEPVDGKARQTRSRSQEGPRRTRHQTAVFFIQVLGACLASEKKLSAELSSYFKQIDFFC